MTLLKHYVNAVRMYLAKGAQEEDILSELSEHLQSKMDEEQEALGRPLTEIEQEALLTEHGNPAIVAERYGAPKRSVAFGWQLIGPESVRPGISVRAGGNRGVRRKRPRPSRYASTRRSGG